MATLETNALAQSINLVTKFESDLHNLLALLGQADVVKVAPGTAFEVFETSGSLSAATVAEKALIPDSNYVTGAGTVKTVTYKKYRNLTSIEKIGTLGYDLAVSKTNDAMLRDIQKGIRADFFSFLACFSDNVISVTSSILSFFKLSRHVKTNSVYVFTHLLAVNHSFVRKRYC